MFDASVRKSKKSERVNVTHCGKVVAGVLRDEKHGCPTGCIRVLSSGASTLVKRKVLEDSSDEELRSGQKADTFDKMRQGYHFSSKQKRVKDGKADEGVLQFSKPKLRLPPGDSESDNDFLLSAVPSMINSAKKRKKGSESQSPELSGLNEEEADEDDDDTPTARRRSSAGAGAGSSGSAAASKVLAPLRKTEFKEFACKMAKDQVKAINSAETLSGAQALVSALCEKSAGAELQAIPLVAAAAVAETAGIKVARHAYEVAVARALACATSAKEFDVFASLLNPDSDEQARMLGGDAGIWRLGFEDSEEGAKNVKAFQEKHIMSNFMKMFRSNVSLEDLACFLVALVAGGAATCAKLKGEIESLSSVLAVVRSGTLPVADVEGLRQKRKSFAMKARTCASV